MHPSFPNLPRVIALACVLLGGCGGESDTADERWISLAAGFAPLVSAADIDLEIGGGSEAERPGAFRISTSEDGGGFWIETTIEENAWGRVPNAAEWSAPNPLLGMIGPGETTDLELFDGEHAFTLTHHRLGHLGVGEFWINASEVVLYHRAADYVPGTATLRFRFQCGESVDGTWRMDYGNEIADAIPVWSGHSEKPAARGPAASVLRFGTAFRHVLPGTRDPEAKARFRVLLGETTLFEVEQSTADATEVLWHEVLLPSAADGLAFAVDGTPGVGIFVNPRLGPVERGTYSERPWGRRRPDLIVFMADTFRADNMESYGGAPGQTPHLDALAARSLCLTRAWATSTWTLPSQASVMTGLYPSQHGADALELPIPRALVTIAEHLAAAGYRTGAVTDSGLISRVYQFDQGFEWFHEIRDWDLRETFEKSLEFLDRDDGRPVFLYVHSYRAHAPYRQGVEEDVSAWNQLLFKALEWTRNELGPDARPVDNFDLLLERYADETSTLYGDGVRALDQQFGDWVAVLEGRDLLKQGYVFFTSDHGEAFGEHGVVCHGGQPWEERVGIPLFILGDAIAPAQVSAPASLLDITCTLAELAGIPDDPAWSGRSLLRLSPDRTIYSFTRDKSELHVGILDGTRKSMNLVALDELHAAECLGIYDLGDDPLETRDLALEEGAGEAEWSRWLPTIEPLLVPVTDVDAIELDAATRQHLKEIGYGGG